MPILGPCREVCILRLPHTYINYYVSLLLDLERSFEMNKSLTREALKSCLLLALKRNSECSQSFTEIAVRSLYLQSTFSFH